MPKTTVLKAILGVSAVAALFAAMAVQAQAPASGQAGQAPAGQTATGQSGQQGATASGAGAAHAAKLSRQDRKILMDMNMAHMAEVEAGRLAHSKTQSEQVRNFAQQMIDDHDKALADVRQLSDAKGVKLPVELDKAHKARINKLAAMSGEAFDRAYMDWAGVADHKKVHTILSHAESRAKDPDLKALAARTLPIVNQHLSSAEQLHKNTAQGSSKTQGSTGASPEKKD